MRRKRPNPDLITLINPGRGARKGRGGTARKAWGSFHQTSGARADDRTIPDVAGGPKEVASLGCFDTLEIVMANGTVVTVPARRSRTRGPWLVTDPSMRRLLVVAADRNPVLASLAHHAGRKVKAVSYYPENPKSAKYQPGVGFRHVFGDGGPLPKRRWPEAYPTLKFVRGRQPAIELVRGKFTVTPRGIVG